MIDCNACEGCHGCPARCGCETYVEVCANCGHSAPPSWLPDSGFLDERVAVTDADAAVAKLARLFSRVDLSAVAHVSRPSVIVVEAQASSDPSKPAWDVLYRGAGEDEVFGLRGYDCTVDLRARREASEGPAHGVMVLVTPESLDRFLAVVGAGALKVTMQEARDALNTDDLEQDTPGS